VAVAVLRDAIAPLCTGVDGCSREKLTRVRLNLLAITNNVSRTVSSMMIGKAVDGVGFVVRVKRREIARLRR